MSGYDHDYHFEDVYTCQIFATLEFPRVKELDVFEQVHEIIDALNDGADIELDTSDIINGIKVTDDIIHIDVDAPDVVECTADGPREDPIQYVDYHWVRRTSIDQGIHVESAHWGDLEYKETRLYD